MRNQQNVKVRVNSSFETICPFPVGYVYMSSNKTSPGSIYGGTWASISGGRYMRAASAWGNGGSNTITQDNLPSHRHSIALTYNVSPGAGATVPAWLNGAANRQYTDFTGGGQHSIPLTKTFGRGTEQPKEGERLCVTSKQFKSGLAARLKRFVHSQLDTSICQAIQQVQQTFMAVRGHLSQMVGFGEQVVHGMVQAVSQHTHSLLRKFQITPILLMFFFSIKKMQERLESYTTQETPRKEVLLRLMSVVEPHTTTCRLTAPAIAGIVPLKVGGC